VGGRGGGGRREGGKEKEKEREERGEESLNNTTKHCKVSMCHEHNLHMAVVTPESKMVNGS